jgi:hypothetical protein
MSEFLHNVQQLQTTIRGVLLREWDPIGIAQTPEAEHEYDGYVAEVYKLVSRRASRQEIFAHLWRVETEHMGLLGNRRKTEFVANRLSEMGQNTNGS